MVEKNQEKKTNESETKPIQYILPDLVRIEGIGLGFYICNDGSSAPSGGCEFGSGGN